MGYAEHLTTAELGLGERSCFWQPGRHTHVPQGSLQPAPVLLLGTKSPSSCLEASPAGPRLYQQLHRGLLAAGPA